MTEYTKKTMMILVFLVLVNGCATTSSGVESAIEYDERHLWDIQIVETDVDVFDLR